MSSYRPNFIRKRRSDDESSDSDEDVPAVKRQRQCNGETSTFPLSILYFKDVVSKKCQTVLQWISDLPLKDFFKHKMLKRSLLAEAPIDIISIDDEDENDVIEITEAGDDITVLADDTDYSLLPNNERRQGPFLSGSLNGFSKPRSASTPFYRDGSLVGSKPSLLSRKPVNGYRSKSLKANGSVSKPAQQQRFNDHCIAPITNPGIDVEILLDSREASVNDSEDLEIISETSNVKQQPCKISIPALSPICKYNRTSNDLSIRHKGMKNGKSPSPSTSRRAPCSNVYTANEVVRLQEKAQYKLLLDKIVNASIYHPVIKNKETTTIQVDLTQDEHEESVRGGHFSKEVLQKPVSKFIEEYYKAPCQLISRKPATSSLEPEQANKTASDEDNDLEVIQTKITEYKPKIKTKPDFFSTDWITELKSSINAETEKRLHVVKQQEEKIKRFRDRRDAKLEEEKRRYEQYKVPGDVFPEPSGGRNDYPDLTSDMEVLIDAALQNVGNEYEELSTFNGVTVTRKHMRTLEDTNWLIDEVLNFYLNLLVERGKLDNYPSVYAFNTFFYAAVKARGVNSVLRWTRKVDIFSYDIILVPLHLNMHWALCVIDNRSKKIQYYDSLGTMEEMCLHYMQKYIIAEMKDKKKVDMDPNEYTLEVVKNLPQQMNGSDCGMFSLKYAEYISRDAKISFEQQHMNYFRRRMVYEILTKQLL